MFSFAVALVALFFSSTTQALPTPAEYEGNITFYGYSSANPTVRFISTFSSNLSEHCDPQGKFAFVVHGWNESINTTWVPDVLANFVKFRGGCVFFMDYSFYGITANYFTLVDHKVGIINVLVKKMRQTNNLEDVYCFGFSFGGRVCPAAGKILGNRTLERMDLCDRAGYGFDYYEDPTPAAKNVACIDTSSDKGTYYQNCDQNFRMGYYGYSQPAAGPPPMGNHGLCPYFFNSSFTYDFVPNNYYKATSARMVVNPPASAMMGYRAEFNRTAIRGDIFVATAQYPPYLVVNNTIVNKPAA